MKTVLILSTSIMVTMICDLCNAQLPAPQHAISKGMMVSVEDYPGSARKADESGLVTVQFLVNAKGQVQDCQTISSSASINLEKQACVMASRLRFKPARDADKKPLSEYWTWSIKWVDPVRRDISIGRLQFQSETNAQTD